MSIYNKADVVRELLERDQIRIIVDPRVDGVVVPEAQKDQMPLALDIGYGMRPNPIPDLEIRDDGISATLSFNRTGEYCFIPWDAVMGLAQRDVIQIVWKHDTPEPEKPKGPALSVVKSSFVGSLLVVA